MNLRVACTIVSKNYFAYAKTLADSFSKENPDADFFILVVDSSNERSRFVHPRAEVVFLEDLQIANWRQLAFKFDILELNTNVKPTLLKFLLAKGYAAAYYLDPDICCYSSLDVLNDALDGANVLLTPHAISPLPHTDGRRPIDRDFLKCGVFNLGFIGVRNTAEALRMLSWWEGHCLEEGFNETAIGLFVDQHWIDLAPCFFDGVHIFKHPGCNVAYWNLHERQVVLSEGRVQVKSSNSIGDLIFFHYSGIDPNGVEKLSKHQNRITLADRPDLRALFEEYAGKLLRNGYDQFRVEQYGFDNFASGERIPSMLRRFFAETAALRIDKDPFVEKSAAHVYAKKLRLLKRPSSGGRKSINSMTVDERGTTLRLAGKVLKLFMMLLGAERFETLSKFMRFYGVHNNQARIL